eukprot:355514_1
MCLYVFIFVIALTMLTVVVSFAISHHMLGWMALLCVSEIVLYDVVLLYLLFRKLFGIFVMRGAQNIEMEIESENPQTIIELDTLETTTAYSTLILLGIISTFVFATLLALKGGNALRLPGGVFIALDIYVNGTCLVLMFAVNKATYS